MNSIMKFGIYSLGLLLFLQTSLFAGALSVRSEGVGIDRKLGVGMMPGDVGKNGFRAKVEIVPEKGDGHAGLVIKSPNIQTTEAMIGFSDNGNENWWVGMNNPSNSFSIYDAFSAGGTGTRFLIDNAGNVGIGTEQPSVKLEVAGTIKANKLILPSQTWADFVFEKNYQLMSLDKLENFIMKEKHLPEIPSSKKVGEKGVSVGEMQVKLLQKVEELTLYVIELKKENDRQNAEIKVLKSKLK